ncbi:15470_t:CDS:2, partial [Entrophospora sp. SA101]
KVENSQQTIITNYHNSIELPNSRITSINRALAKFFITCGISFRIVEHPFFINFAKELNSGYEPPSREILSGQLLERELSQVNSKVKSEIEKETNLTLAIVSDNASNVRNARAIIQQKYPNIENVRCIAHAINLIACDTVKENFGDRLLRRVNNLATFFKSSHQAGAVLFQLIKENKINGGGIKMYCKTRWTTASESVESVIRLEPVLEEITSQHNYLLNDKVKHIIQGRNFFSDLRILAFVLNPLRKAILTLENTPLKKGAYAKVVKCAMKIGKRLGFDLHESKILCEQLRKYKDHEEPFDLDIVCCSEDPTSWWNLIDTDSQPDTLPTLARYLFSICPNSASCERGFSMLGWLFYKQRLNLNLQQLESMSKMIMYWKSNAKTELGFYGFNNKKKTHLNNCIVLIENIWIEKFVDLSHNLIIKEIGNIPEDVLDDYVNSDIDEYENVNMTNEDGKGILDYDIDGLLGEFLSEEV